MRHGCNPQGSRVAQPDQNTVLPSPPVSSSLPFALPPLFSPLLLIWSGIHSLLFAILMKIRHLHCQPSPLSADPCHNNKEQKTEKKGGRKKSWWGEKRGREPICKEGYYVTAGLVDWIVRWPSEGRKKWSLSLCCWDRGLLTQLKESRYDVGCQSAQGT